MLFSQRNNIKDIDLFPYDGDVPERLRIQIFHLIIAVYEIRNTEFVGLTSDALNQVFYKNAFAEIRQHLLEEHGLLSLLDAPGDTTDGPNEIESCLDFLLYCEEGDWVIDMVELLIKFAFDWNLIGPQTIETLNKRFRENGIGLEFVEDRFIKINSTILHVEAVRPALMLMRSTGFSGPLDEYLEAHEQYRNGDNKAAITSAAKAFESTMKTICQAKGWPTSKGTAAALIQALFDNQFLPNYYQTQLNSLRTTLEGLPTVRNNNTGHGQGPNIIDIPDYLTQYALNLAGANITLLIQIYNKHFIKGESK
ncbi:MULTISPECIES: STM4504/CBY_0614 family protein [unclassified Exiguobacterium]|uniref:STM4504/CBY_0614 family protein n=1 Tax=unclassified Exiguobacterium TaxID=2644629 RepID=UPI0013585527|nr:MULTISPECIES: hypothetical protein [unclassified Exiguobacterium]